MIQYLYLAVLFVLYHTPPLMQYIFCFILSPLQSGLDRVFCTCFYNHTRRLRLENLLYLGTRNFS